MTRSITVGSGNTDTANYPDPFVINVGPQRTFTNIRDAVDSLLGLRFNQQIIIQVDDGAYNHYPVYLDNPNLSGRLTIQGNIANPAALVLNCTPDPLLNQRIKPGTNIGTPNTANKLDNTADFSNISYGFLAVDGFKLKLSGFQINGSVNDQVNVTHYALGAINGGSIFCLENSMIISGGMDGIVAVRFGKVSANRIIFAQVQNVSVWAFYKTWVSVNGAQFIGPGSTSAGFTLTMTSINGANNPSITYRALPFSIHDGSVGYFGRSTFSHFPLGASVQFQAYAYLANTSWNDIADTSGCVQVTNRGTALAGGASYYQVSLPMASNNSSLFVDYSNFTGQISTGLRTYANSYIDATGCLASLNAIGKSPSLDGYTSNVARSDGGFITYN